MARGAGESQRRLILNRLPDAVLNLAGTVEVAGEVTAVGPLADDLLVNVKELRHRRGRQETVEVDVEDLGCDPSFAGVAELVIQR